MRLEESTAYAGATRLQTVIDSLEEDSILVDHCAEDNRDLITEVINDASRVNADVDDTSTSLMETSGGLFNLTPEPLPPPPDDDGGSADEEVTVEYYLCLFQHQSHMKKY